MFPYYEIREAIANNPVIAVEYNGSETAVLERVQEDGRLVVVIKEDRADAYLADDFCYLVYIEVRVRVAATG
jgi:hypothetical protein